jgi:mono/diheme cytochrome c family protein
MRTIIKTLKWILILFIILALGGISYLKFALPNVEAPADLKVEITPERLERGRYLANHVNVCMDCHSSRDFSLLSGPPRPGTEGSGGELFNEELGFPGTFYSKNITPHGIGNWTDGELYRAITSGVDKNNEVIFPVMPWLYYNKMATEDIYSIIAYIRSLNPIATEKLISKTNFPVSLIKNTFPVAPHPSEIPDKSDRISYGAYITNAAGCVECHSKKDSQGSNIPGTEFGGGTGFTLPGSGTVFSPNLTSDATTGLKISEEAFIALFKSYADSSYVLPSVKPGEFQTIMPWKMYSGMTEEDLSAIYTYLKSIPAIQNQVENRFVSAVLK